VSQLSYSNKWEYHIINIVIFYKSQHNYEERAQLRPFVGLKQITMTHMRANSDTLFGHDISFINLSMRTLQNTVKQMSLSIVALP
jgi:hypothetical protein